MADILEIPSLEEFALNNPDLPMEKETSLSAINDIPSLEDYAKTLSSPRKPARKLDTKKEVFQPANVDWSLSKLNSIQEFFKKTFNTDLPVRVVGQGEVQNKFNYDHRGSADIGLDPDSREGQRLIQYLKENNIPFLAFKDAIPGVSTGKHIHIGKPSQHTDVNYTVGTTLQSNEALVKPEDIPSLEEFAAQQTLPTNIPSLEEFSKEPEVVKEKNQTAPLEIMDLTLATDPNKIDFKVAEKQVPELLDWATRYNKPVISGQNPFQAGELIQEDFEYDMMPDLNTGIDYLLQKWNPEYADLNANFRAETGGLNILNVQNSGEFIEPLGNNKFRVKARPTRGAMALIEAYKTGGLPAYNATLELINAQKETILKKNRMDLALIENYKEKHPYMAAFESSFEREVASTTQLAQNMARISKAAFVSAYKGGNSQEFLDLINREIEDQAVLDQLTEGIYNPPSLEGKIIAGATSGVISLPRFIVAGKLLGGAGLPLMVYAEHLHKGNREAAISALPMAILAATMHGGTEFYGATSGTAAPLARVPRTAGKFTREDLSLFTERIAKGPEVSIRNLTPLERQLVLRGGNALASGITSFVADPNQKVEDIIANVVVGLGFPVGKGPKAAKFAEYTGEPIKPFRPVEIKGTGLITGRGLPDLSQQLGQRRIEVPITEATQKDVITQIRDINPVIYPSAETPDVIKYAPIREGQRDISDPLQYVAETEKGFEARGSGQNIHLDLDTANLNLLELQRALEEGTYKNPGDSLATSLQKQQAIKNAISVLEQAIPPETIEFFKANEAVIREALKTNYEAANNKQEFIKRRNETLKPEEVVPQPEQEIKPVTTGEETPNEIFGDTGVANEGTSQEGAHNFANDLFKISTLGQRGSFSNKPLEGKGIVAQTKDELNYLSAFFIEDLYKRGIVPTVDVIANKIKVVAGDAAKYITDEQIKNGFNAGMAFYNANVADPFFSRMKQDAAEKLPKRFTEEQARNILSQHKDEFEWTAGLQDFLDANKGQKINKQDLIDILNKGQVKVEESIAEEGEGTESFAIQNRRSQIERRLDEISNAQVEGHNEFPPVKSITDRISLLNKEQLDAYDKGDMAKYARLETEITGLDTEKARIIRDNAREYNEYFNKLHEEDVALNAEDRKLRERQEEIRDSLPVYSNKRWRGSEKLELPGAENSREVKLITPILQPEYTDIGNWKRLESADIGRSHVISPKEGKGNYAWENTRTGDVIYSSSEINPPIDFASRQQYTDPHFNIGNNVAHYRANDRTTFDGTLRLLFGEEFQSDWNHDIRERGLKRSKISIDNFPEEYIVEPFTKYSLEDKEVNAYAIRNKYNNQILETGATPEEAKQNTVNWYNRNLGDGVEPNPFMQHNWKELILKRFLRDAAVAKNPYYKFKAKVEIRGEDSQGSFFPEGENSKWTLVDIIPAGQRWNNTLKKTEWTNEQYVWEDSDGLHYNSEYSNVNPDYEKRFTEAKKYYDVRSANGEMVTFQDKVKADEYVNEQNKLGEKEYKYDGIGWTTAKQQMARYGGILEGKHFKWQKNSDGTYTFKFQRTEEPEGAGFFAPHELQNITLERFAELTTPEAAQEVKDQEVKSTAKLLKELPSKYSYERSMDMNNWKVVAKNPETFLLDEELSYAPTKEEAKQKALAILNSDKIKGQFSLKEAVELRKDGEKYADYDVALVNMAKKLGKRFGAKYSEKEIPIGNQESKVIVNDSIDIQLANAAGQKIYNANDNIVADPYKALEEGADLYTIEQHPKTEKIHYLEITPSMRQSLEKEGLPLYGLGGQEPLKSPEVGIRNRLTTIEGFNTHRDLLVKALKDAIPEQTPEDLFTPNERAKFEQAILDANKEDLENFQLLINERRGNVFNSGLSPDAFIDQAKLLYNGMKDFTEFSSEMLKRFGEQVRPFLQDLWMEVKNLTRKFHEDERGFWNISRRQQPEAEKLYRERKKKSLSDKLYYKNYDIHRGVMIAQSDPNASQVYDVARVGQRDKAYFLDSVLHSLRSANKILENHNEQDVAKTITIGNFREQKLYTPAELAAGDAVTGRPALNPEQIQAYNDVYKAEHTILDKRLQQVLFGYRERANKLNAQLTTATSPTQVTNIHTQLLDIADAMNKARVHFARLKNTGYISTKRNGPIAAFVQDPAFPVGDKRGEVYNQFKSAKEAGIWVKQQEDLLGANPAQSSIYDLNIPERLRAAAQKLTPAQFEELVDAAGVNSRAQEVEKLRDEIYTRYPSAGYELKRENVRGFDDSWQGIIQSVTSQTEAYANSFYSRVAGEHMIKALNATNLQQTNVDLFKALQRYIDHEISSPEQSRTGTIAGYARKGVYLFQLGGDINQLYLNAIAQPVSQTYSYFARVKYNGNMLKFGEPEKYWVKAWGLANNLAKDNLLGGTRTPQEFRDIYARLKAEGVVSAEWNKSLLELETEKTVQAKLKAKSIGDRLQHWSGAFMRAGELTTRAHAAAEAYLVGRERFNLTGEELVTFMVRAIDATQSNPSRAEAPLIVRGKQNTGEIRKSTYQFNAFNHMWVENLALNVRSDFQNRRILTSATARHIAPVVIMGGITGLPLSGLMSALAQAITGEDPRKKLHEFVGNQKFLERLALYGITTNATISNKVSPKIPFVEDVLQDTFLSDKTWSEILITSRIPAITTAGQFASGVKDFIKGDYLRGIGGAFPVKPVRNIATAIRYSKKGIKTRAGTTVVPKSKINSFTLIGQGLGIPPSAMVEHYEDKTHKGQVTLIRKFRNKIKRKLQ